MVIVRSPFPSHVGATDPRGRRTRWFLGLVLTGSLVLNAVLLLRGTDAPPAARPKSDPSRTSADSATPEAAPPGLATEDPPLESEPASLDPEVVRLRERLEPFEKMAPGDAIVFSGRDFGWILRRLWELPPDQREQGIDRLVTELIRREDSPDTILRSLFGESDPGALSALALLLERAGSSSEALAPRRLRLHRDDATRVRIVEALRAGIPSERRLAAAHALAVFTAGATERDSADALAAALPDVRDPAVVEALGRSLREHDVALQHAALRNALLSAANTVDRRARRALLATYAHAFNGHRDERLQGPLVDLRSVWDTEPDPRRREDLAYAFAFADVTSNPVEYGKASEAERHKARDRLLAAYREATDPESRRYLAAAALRTGAFGVEPERSASIAKMAASEPVAGYRARLEDVARRLAQGEAFDAVPVVLATE